MDKIKDIVMLDVTGGTLIGKIHIDTLLVSYFKYDTGGAIGFNPDENDGINYNMNPLMALEVCLSKRECVLVGLYVTPLKFSLDDPDVSGIISRCVANTLHIETNNYYKTHNPSIFRRIFRRDSIRKEVEDHLIEKFHIRQPELSAVMEF